MASQRFGRLGGLLALIVVVLVVANIVLTKASDVTGIPPGQRFAPFAVPLAASTLSGDANIATRRGQGAAGEVPACSVRGPRVLNVCQLYEGGPVVLALFVDGGSCAAVLGQLQALVPSFPGVRFAAVSIKGDRGSLRGLLRSRGITIPVGIDEDGALASLYKLITCPQVNFALPGGVVQSPAMLKGISTASLRARVGDLVAAARARGWREPAG